MFRLFNITNTLHDQWWIQDFPGGEGEARQSIYNFLKKNYMKLRRIGPCMPISVNDDVCLYFT